jgi:uncharacterized SAM-binding protein YcdF (DUF218 family)
VLLAAGFALAALVLVWVLAYLQGQRDDAQQADAIVVLYAPTSEQHYVGHALNLYERQLADTVVLAGDNSQELKDTLARDGVPAEDLLSVDTSPASAARTRISRIAELAYAQGVRSIVLVSDADHLLLDLKIARDMGLMAYGSPAPAQSRELQEIVQTGFEYWQYVLLGSD